jgi:putative SOS response-associated peptidase YedK
MCYHYELKATAADLRKRFEAISKMSEAPLPSAPVNGFDFAALPIVTGKEQAVLQTAHWGLIPAWSKDLSIRQHTLNARWETLHEKASFRNILSQRCLIPATAFFEWKWLNAKGTRKEKFRIGLDGMELFSFAGLWDQWLRPEDGAAILSFSIITTEAKGIMRDIHNSKLRQPAALLPEEEKAWLGGEPVELNKELPWKATSLEPPAPTLFD